jgi:hypothetical protein
MDDWQTYLIETAPDSAFAMVVAGAISELLRRDGALLERDVNERTISGNLARYLGAVLPDWHVDAEYNRDGIQPKRAGRHLVVPDVIVHRRGRPDNLLVIEIKKGNDPSVDASDLEKLATFRGDPLRYRYALYIRFATPPHAIGVARLQWV